MTDLPLNVAPWERWVSLLGGAALLAAALRRPSRISPLLAAGGALLIERGLSGHCMIYRLIGKGSAAREPQPDPVYTTSYDSFPASDPPSWTPMSGLGYPHTSA